jgi:hypothetical protein
MDEFDALGKIEMERECKELWQSVYAMAVRAACSPELANMHARAAVDNYRDEFRHGMGTR